MTRGQRGFTLIEVLIALAIVGALLAVAFGGLRVAIAAWRQGEDRAEAHQQARGIAIALARTLGAAYPYSAPRGEAPTPVLLFLGEPDRIELVTQAPLLSSAVPIAFTAMVLEVEGGARSGLVVRQQALPNRDPFTAAEVVLREPSIASLTFAYLDDNGSWHDRWDPDGETERKLPRGIRITVGTGIGGRLETLPPITVSLKVVAR